MENKFVSMSCDICGEYEDKIKIFATPVQWGADVKVLIHCEGCKTTVEVPNCGISYSNYKNLIKTGEKINP